MSKTKQRLWTKFGGKEFFARMAENATNDGDGNEIAQTYATNDDLATKQNTLTFGYNSNSQIVSIDSHDLAPSADSTVYLANYNSTRGDAVSAALLAGKAVMCKSFHDGDTANPKFGLLGTYNRANNQYQYTFIRKITHTYEQATGDIAFTSVFNASAGDSWFDQFYNLTFKAPTAEGQVMKSVNVNNSHFDWALSTVREVPASTSSDADKVLTVNAQGTPVWTTVQGYATDPTIDDSLLLGQSDGSKTWTALERDTFGSLTDDNDGDEIQDEEGNSIGDENSVELWTSFNGTGFGAERAVADVDGNPLNLTISNDQVIAIGGKSIGGGTVVDAYTKAETDVLLADKANKSELPILRQAEATEDTTINVVNNRVTWVSNITYSTMTFNVAVPSGESANFAVELLSQHACTVSVTVNGVQVPKASAALNELEAGKTYQLTCVGYGWTCVEIDVPSYTVTIDSKTYGATRLGNHLWTTENLDYLFTGCTLNGTPDDKPMAWNNSADPTYEGKYGLVYNYKAVLYLAEHADELLPSGWRLPTLDDWRQLGATIGWDPTQSGQMVTGDKANAFRSTEWYLYNSATRQADIQGTNLYGLNVLPAGTFANGEFSNIGSSGSSVCFWASDSLDSGQLWFASVGHHYGWSSNYSPTSEAVYNYGCHIRLIKDL